jgi:large subunit ribosomal protein L2
MYQPPTTTELEGALRGTVIDILDDPGRTGLLCQLLLEDGRKIYNLAAEGLAVGQEVWFGNNAPAKNGCVLPLEKIPDGTPIFNIEKVPQDGGKFARAAGTAAYIVAHNEINGRVSIRLSSRAVVELDPRSRATIGVVSGGGRLEKPIVKAGTAFYINHARNRLWPKVRGTAMSAYDHPHGGRSLGKSNTVARNTPPGRKVGSVAARRTGRRRGKSTE